MMKNMHDKKKESTSGFILINFAVIIYLTRRIAQLRKNPSLKFSLKLKISDLIF